MVEEGGTMRYGTLTLIAAVTAALLVSAGGAGVTAERIETTASIPRGTRVT
jgi:hypothetical protein